MTHPATQYVNYCLKCNDVYDNDIVVKINSSLSVARLGLRSTPRTILLLPRGTRATSTRTIYSYYGRYCDGLPAGYATCVGNEEKWLISTTQSTVA